MATYRKLIKSTTFQEQLKRLSSLLISFGGVKMTGFYAVNAFIKLLVPRIFMTRFKL